jgi:endo-1,4-beta-xylanase
MYRKCFNSAAKSEISDYTGYQKNTPSGKLLITFKNFRIPIVLLILISFLTAKSFSQLAAGKEKFLGAATSSSIFRNFATYWNQGTPGNDGKWGSLTYARGQYNWTSLDYIYNFMTNRGLLYKHHNLVWGSQQPSWIAGLDSANQRTEVENWIKLVGEKYPKMAMVDVVNEPFHSVPSYKNALGGDGTTGWDWVITAFQLARKYCASGVKLVLNEYNVLSSTSVTTNYLSLINLLKDRGLIDGIGIQGHYFEFRSDMNATSNKYIYDIPTIKSNLNRLTATGIPVYITEFDIDEPIDSNQVSQYKTYFPIFWTNPGVKGITLWGYISDDIWTSHPDTYLLFADGTERPSMKWLRAYVALALPPVLVSPVTASDIPLSTILVWNTANTSTSYHVQVSSNSQFTSTSIDTVIADTSIKIKNLSPRTLYSWHVSAKNENGEGDYSATASFTTTASSVSVNQNTQVPVNYRLMQNYPNPFNPSTTIKFSLPAKSNVNMTLLNTLGQQIRVILNSELEAGEHQVVFNASGLPTGVYFYKFEAGQFTDIKKLVLMK